MIRTLLWFFLVFFLSCSSYRVVIVDIEAASEETALNRFIGEWEFSNTKETFRIKLLPKRVNYGDSFSELLLGYHIYIKNGDTIQNSYPQKRRNKNNLEGYTLFGFVEDKGKTLLKAGFNDMVLTKHGTVRLKPTDKENQMKWTLGEKEGEEMNLVIDEKPTRDKRPGFRVPTDVLLKKIDQYRKK